MKVLFVAKAVDPDRTSAGINSSKLIAAFSQAGHEITCLTAEQTGFGRGPAVARWLGPVQVRSVAIRKQFSPSHYANRFAEAAARRGRIGNWISQKFNGGTAYLTGFAPWYWSEVSDWRFALRQNMPAVEPDVVFVRGAGLSFEPHMAMMGLRSSVPWIANYHDPFPISLYPEPYRSQSARSVTAFQEFWHRRIVGAATALTFPSQRLLEWVLKGELERHREKAFVVPHVALELDWSEPSSLPADLPRLREDEFSLVHTGTLIPARHADVLIEAFLDFLAENPRERGKAKLVLVGGIHRSHENSPIMERAKRHPNVVVVNRRVRYRDAMSLSRRSPVPVILEARANHSPFFPGKLSDCLWLGKPFLALTPRESAISDLVGRDHPLCVTPGDKSGLRRALNLLWECWRNGSLAALAPPESIRETVSADAVNRRFDEVVAYCRGSRQDTVQHVPVSPSRRPVKIGPKAVTEDGGTDLASSPHRPLRVMVIFGTRPEAIKLCPLIRYLAEEGPDQFHVRTVVTAQHRSMLDQVLQAFEINPDHDLDLMTEGQTLADVTGRILTALPAIFAAENPELVIVQGDTTTTFAAALAACYARIPVAHVEAGLRSGDSLRPYPEEVNRLLTTRLSTMHFAATQTAASNLLREGVPERNIWTTGNTVIDAVHYIHSGLIQGRIPRPAYSFLDPSRRLILATAHRRESFGRDLEAICGALLTLANRSDVDVVFPVHQNPRVREPAQRILSQCPHVHLLEPLDYPAFIDLLGRCYFVLTDSGGIQEEAPSLGKPVLVLRQNTERPEAIEAGAALLVGTNAARIAAEAGRLLDDQEHYHQMARRRNPFGDGKACERIAAVLQQYAKQIRTSRLSAKSASA